MATITIVDPVTRIEGHMKVELSMDQGRIVDAKCSGTLFRGFETLLQGREPWDAPVITQRICGVCPISHGQASVLAVEGAAGWTPPPNGRILRNLTLGANFVQSHILHFYFLAAMDYMKGPQVAPWVPAWDVDMRPNVGPIVEHFVQSAVEARRRAHEMGAVFGGKMPASHAFIPGGFTATPTAERIDRFREQLTWLLAFIRDTYIPDVESLAAAYPDYRSIGRGCENLLAYGVFKEDDFDHQKLLRAGYSFGGQTWPEPLQPGDHAQITESVAASWYEDATGGLTPAEGDTRPAYPKEGAYSWLKAPRFQTHPFEVGPLARMWVNGDYLDGISVMDRHLARARETLKIAEAMDRWLDELILFDGVFERREPPASGVGVGMTEAPRGALGHWVEVADGRIRHYQIITPTCWNASPRDDDGTPGPMEQALIGTPVQDPDRPIEALRVIHSFDPCLSCAVHITRPDGEPRVIRAGAG